MTTESRKAKAKAIPSILSKLKAIQNAPSAESREVKGRGSRQESREEGVESRARGEIRVTPRTAWASSRRESLMSSVSSTNGPGEGSRASLFSRIPSMMSLGGATAWGKRLRKKKDAEEYAAQRLARQREEMMAFYRGTPMTDDRATSKEILQFLYEMWQPQLCASYRKDVKITTTCRQDMRSAKRLAQTTPRRLAKLHRARLVINACSSHVGDGTLDSQRSNPGARPLSAKSVT